MAKNYLFRGWCLVSGVSACKRKYKINLYFQTCSKIKSRWVVILNGMYKTLNVPEGRREYFHELGVCMKLFFHYDSSKGKKIDNWITLSQNFSSPKERENAVWKQHI